MKSVASKIAPQLEASLSPGADADLTEVPKVVRLKKRGRPKTGEGPGLTRDQLIKAVLRLAEEEVEAALNMRRVAEEVGVSVRLLYTVVHSRDELLDLLNDAVIANCRTPPLDWPWQKRLTAIATTVRKAQARCPGLPLLTFVRSIQNFDSPNAARLQNDVLQCFLAAGLPEEEASKTVIAYQALFMGHLAFTALAAQGPVRNGPPSLASTRAWFDDSFELGFDRFVQGIEQRVRDLKSVTNKTKKGKTQ